MSAARPGAPWCERPPRPGWAAHERVAVASSRFAVYRLEAGVFALYEPFQAQEVISWLILGEERALLFDTGMGLAPIRPVVEALTGLPVVVLNSHTHYDHMGGNADFEAILALDTDYGRRNAGGWARDAVAGELVPSAFCAEKLPGFDPTSFRIRPFRATGLVYFPGTDLDAYARRVRRLARLAPGLKRVFPSHNTPVAAPERLKQLAQAFDRVRENAARSRPSRDGLVEYPFEGFSFLMRGTGPAS